MKIINLRLLDFHYTFPLFSSYLVLFIACLLMPFILIPYLIKKEFSTLKWFVKETKGYDLIIARNLFEKLNESQQKKVVSGYLDLLEKRDSLAYDFLSTIVFDYTTTEQKLITKFEEDLLDCGRIEIN